MSTLHLKSPPNSTNLKIPLNSTNIRFPLMSTKNLEITLDYINWLWLLHYHKLSRNLSLIYESTKRTSILL